MATQLRITGTTVIGFDMTAALALARAAGIPAPAIVDLLPPIEAAMVRELNRKQDG